MTVSLIAMLSVCDFSRDCKCVMLAWVSPPGRKPAGWVCAGLWHDGGTSAAPAGAMLSVGVCTAECSCGVFLQRGHCGLWEKALGRPQENDHHIEEHRKEQSAQPLTHIPGKGRL